MKHIVYAATTCSDQVYRQLFSDAKVKPAFQSQKYHRLLIEGLASHTRVDVVACPPVNRTTMKKPWQPLPDQEEGGAHYHHVPAVRHPLLKVAVMAFCTFFGTLKYTRRDSAVVVDVLNRTTALFALFASRLRGCPCVGIVTDLPDMLSGSRFSKKLANFVTRHCTHYVVLTEAMNEYVNHSGKPYVVLEGHADIAMTQMHPSPDKKITPRICFYAGGVSRQYGLEMLAQGFLLANIPNTQLHIYGPGDYVEDLKVLSGEDCRIFYGGMLMNSQIVEKELQATLLVNPRPTDAEYVKYSFPSKTMEYMASGTPVLTTRLPGMPREYEPYVNFIDTETPEGIAEALTRVLSRQDSELYAQGRAARKFVLEERNNRVQARKILDMLK